MTRDSGSIVLGWLTRLTMVIGVVGLIGFDGIALVKTDFAANDHAGSAAVAGAEAYRQTKDVQQAYTAALDAASGDAIDPKKFTVDPSTGTIHLTVTENAVTLWMHKIGPLRKYTVIHAAADASPSTQ